MAENPQTLDEALAYLEKRSVTTSRGVYVKLDDVKKLMEERKTAGQIEKQEAPRPKDMNQAKQMVLRDEKIMANFPPPTPKLGKSISAQPQPSSRT